MNDLGSGARRGVAALLLLCLSTEPVVGAERPYGGATPQDLVARMRAGAEAGDLGEMMACMAPEDRKAIGEAMLMVTVMMVGFSQMGADMGSAMVEGMTEAFSGEEMTAEQEAELEARKAEAAEAAAELTDKLRAALEPHGLAGLLDADFAPGSPEDQAMEEALENADMIALTESVTALLEELDDAEAGDEAALDPAEEAKPAWMDAEVTDYVVDGDRATARAGDETLEMIRLDGRWYFTPRVEAETGPEDPGEPEG